MDGQLIENERPDSKTVCVVCASFYLLLCSFSVDHVDIDPFIHQLVEKLPRSLYGLNEHQHGRQETLEHKEEKHASLHQLKRLKTTKRHSLLF